jgi:hypothetical protein
MLGRRKFLGNVGATAAVVAAASSLGEIGGPDATTTASTVGEEAREAKALAGAGVGPKARFGTCEVLSLESTPDGAVSVRLADSAGQPFEVELLGYDPHTPGVARAGSLGVYMNNRGRGTTATIEEHGLAAMALARHLARGEAAGAKLPVLPRLSERSTGSARA